MLKLICDVKCGYENLYIVEKDAVFPLDFLTDKKLFSSLFDTTKMVLPKEADLFNAYQNNPNELIKAYGLFNILRTIVSTEYLLKFFNGINDKLHPFFPEIFKLENVKLVVDFDGQGFADAFNKDDNSGNEDDDRVDRTDYTA